jgi:hypothetical protein
MKTTFEKLEPFDLFENDIGQLMVKGFGIFWNTGLIIKCPEDSRGRFYMEEDAPVVHLYTFKGAGSASVEELAAQIKAK